MTYLEIIRLKFPQFTVVQVLDDTYEGIVWNELDTSTKPTKEQLDAAIAEYLGTNNITKYQFRKLFTLAERVAVDNAQANPNIAAQHKATLVTIMKDLEVSGVVELHNPDVAQGVRFLEQVGLIATGRADCILSNLPPI